MKNKIYFADGGSSLVSEPQPDPPFGEDPNQKDAEALNKAFKNATPADRATRRFLLARGSVTDAHLV